LKQEGDSIKELEPLLEVNTDKVDTEIPAPATGVILKIVAQEGQVGKVGELLAIIGMEGEEVDSNQLTADHEKEEAKVDSNQTSSKPATINLKSSADLGFISPVVAKIAAEHGINLSQVQGTGLNGRITKNDVLAFVGNRESGVVSSTKPATIQSSNLQPGTLIKHSVIRKSIAQHMVESKHTSP